MTTSMARRMIRLVLVSCMLMALLVPAAALADKRCSAYYHTHNYGYHTYYTHHVYNTNPSGTGEWTYWYKDYYNYGIVYQNVYYGSLYCA